MPYAPLGNLRLYYEELGYGDPILFLHSHFSRGILAFSGQIQAFHGNYHCFFPDFRGHGRTLCDDLTWDSRRIADDMILFMDYLNIGRAHLFGYSMGTYVGLYMASGHPERVRSFAAVGAGIAPVPEGSEDYLPEKIMERNDTKLINDIKARHFNAHKGNWQEFMRQPPPPFRIGAGKGDQCSGVGFSF